MDRSHTRRTRLPRAVRTSLCVAVLTVIFLLVVSGVAFADVWTDISDATWQSVYHVSAADAFTVAEGYPDHTFRPDQAVTRGQFAKMAASGLGIPLLNPPSPKFSDVPTGHIFYRYIEGAVAAGVISGYPDGTYRPENNIVRQQTNKILGSWLAQEEIAALGGIQGAHGIYSSLATWFAAEGEGVLAGFADQAQVAAVHRPATAYLVMRGVVLGSSSGGTKSLKPLGELTRAQAVTMILRTKDVVGAPTPKENLGRQLFFDTRLSEPAGQACAACHDPGVGYTGGDEKINAAGAVYEGAMAGRFGNRKPPAAAYAGGSPVFANVAGTFTGGMFWDGRKTGWILGDPLAEQAGGPFLNPLEQNNPNMAAVVDKVKTGPYAKLFVQVWGQHAFDDTQKAYDFISRSIAAYERSGEVSRFDSRFDTYLGTGKGLTAVELQGLALFKGKANCANCHVTTPDQAAGGVVFTDYTYDNLGIPKNPKNPFYGEPAFNPATTAWIDLGLGGFLVKEPAFASQAGGQMGKFKVPTLRNVDKRPDPGFVKAYGHNGYFKSLDEIVHFYNTRDVPGAGWPAPEYATNMNTIDMGNLGLTPAEETAIVAFLKTLTDR